VQGLRRKRRVGVGGKLPVLDRTPKERLVPGESGFPDAPLSYRADGELADELGRLTTVHEFM
jgi:hypothetical protein